MHSYVSMEEMNETELKTTLKRLEMHVCQHWSILINIHILGVHSSVSGSACVLKLSAFSYKHVPGCVFCVQVDLESCKTLNMSVRTLKNTAY